MMHRRGHVGVAMLAYAPVGFVLLAERQLGLALLGLFGVLAVEPLPDNDMWIPFLDHRETSHSLFCALAVGGVIGTLGWLIGGWMAGFFIGLDASAVGVFAGVFQLVGEQFRGLDASALARFGFAVGFFGILAHLLGDVITVSGIRPLLPLSRWQLSLSRLRADNSIANNALFGLGVVGLLLVAFATAPGVGLAAAAADLSPVGVASAQSATASGNQTTASVDIDSSNNTTATTVVVSKVRVPNGGFVAIHDGGYAEAGNLRQSAITVSKYLSAGVHKNVSIPVKRGVPGIAGNSTRLNFARTNLSAVVYRDTNNNTQYDFAASFGSADTPYQAQNGGAVADTEQVTIEKNVQQAKQQSQPAPASIRFADQQLQQGASHPSVTISRVNLSEGGFVVIHDKRYLGPTRDPLNSAIGVSSYLSPGVHRNVTVPLLDGSVTSTQTLVAVPYLDTNGNQTYDYVKTGGEVDYAYIARQNNSTVIINDTATVSVEETGGVFGGTATTPTATTTATTTLINASTPFRVTNLTVSNRTAHVNDEVTITAWVTNPTDSRLKDELALATAGTAAETKEVALFPRGKRAVTFEYSYSAPGEYVIKVANHTEQIRIVEEGAPLPTITTTTAANSSRSQAASAQSGGATGLNDILLPVVVLAILVVGGVLLAIWRRR
jgi:membrane-bound metal-dependent hydrolase YbcI (DUF457 family)